MTTEIIMKAVHPGEILLEVFLKPLSLSRYQLAKELNSPARRINEMVDGERGLQLTLLCAWPASSEPRSGSG